MQEGEIRIFFGIGGTGGRIMRNGTVEVVTADEALAEAQERIDRAKREAHEAESNTLNDAAARGDIPQ